MPNIFKDNKVLIFERGIFQRSAFYLGWYILLTPSTWTNKMDLVMNYLNEPPMDYPKCKPLKFLTQKSKNQFVFSCSNLLGTIFKRHRFCMHCVPFIII